MKKIGFLGLGIMGAGMARQLLDAGHELVVWNRSPGRTGPLVDAGAQLADNPAEAATGADAVVAMVAEDEASRQTWLGDQGALAAMKKGSVAIECSTLSPGWVTALAADMAHSQIHFVEAPVTGSKIQAHNGTLRFFVGSDADSLDLARPVLDAMGTEAIHLGPAGSGAVMKLANNFMSGLQVASFAEALALAEARGLDPVKVADVLRGGAPGSPMVGLMADRMLARDYTPNFLMPLMAKDMAYARALLEAAGIHSDLAQAALARFRQAVDDGYADCDMSAVIEPLRKK